MTRFFWPLSAMRVLAADVAKQPLKHVRTRVLLIFVATLGLSTTAVAFYPSYYDFEPMSPADSKEILAGCVGDILGRDGVILTVELMRFTLFQNSNQCIEGHLRKSCKTIAVRTGGTSCTTPFYVSKRLERYILELSIDDIRAFDYIPVVRHAIRDIEKNPDAVLLVGGLGVSKDQRSTDILFVDAPSGLAVVNLGE